VERFKNINSPTELAEEATRIWTNYVANKGQYQVNIASDIKEEISSKLEAKTVNNTLFDKAQSQVFELLKCDAFQRYINQQRSALREDSDD
jgi:hypothetical protein